MPLLERPQIVAVFDPVDPGVDWTDPSPSPSRLQVLLAQWESKTGVMVLGARSVFVEVVAKKPTTVSFFAVVVTDGATNEVLCGTYAPLCESTGEVGSIPLKSRIAPAADT
jgi:hypothetical protein